MADYDVFIIGGGINGCGIARDAAGRGYSVALAEMNDFASGTSSWSTKLIHGGLRYLEHYEFRLVRESLMEREVLWSMAPHIIRPLRFVLPLHRGLRPAWILRIGLLLYDHIGGRKRLKPTRAVDLTGPLGVPLKPGFTRGFEYSDARVDDARLVILNARDAAARGADLMVRTEVVEAVRTGTHWKVTVRDRETGETRTVSARFLINAAGPWVDRVIQEALGHSEARNIRLVQGSHVVVPRLFDHDRAYIFQNADARIVFAIPYQGDYTLIGTTDRDYRGDPGEVAISPEEVDYLCGAANEYFSRRLEPSDIVWTYSGVRPLFDDGASKAQEATRDYVLKVDGEADRAPVLHVFGGKLTTYRRLAEEALRDIGRHLGEKGEPWTAGSTLPGGDFPVDGLPALEARIAAAAPSLPQATVQRLARAYGTEALALLKHSGGGLGGDFGHGLFGCEVDWLVEKEWARTAEDILWRRSKLGLRFGPAEVAALDAYLRARRPSDRNAAPPPALPRPGSARNLPLRG